MGNPDQEKRPAHTGGRWCALPKLYFSEAARHHAGMYSISLNPALRLGGRPPLRYERMTDTGSLDRKNNSPGEAAWLSWQRVLGLARRNSAMALKEQSGVESPARRGRGRPPSSSTSADREADLDFSRCCKKTARKSRRHLLAVAIARGCRHYAPLWPELKPEDDPQLPHEAIGCALLRGPADAETFQAIRCGAMVLGDLANSPKQVAIAAELFGVVDRVAHIARIGSAADEHRMFWQQILKVLSVQKGTDGDFLPSVSRLVAETRVSGPGGGPARVWLRTAYRR